MGNGNNLGPATIREYSGSGEYLRTVFPFPASKPLEQMKGWGLYDKPDGTYSPKYNDVLSSPAVSTTLISSTRGGCASILSTPSTETLTLRMGMEKMVIGVDSTLKDYKPESVIGEPLMKKGEITELILTHILSIKRRCI
jgi:hypothetical protein